jgi:hypothetical protein
MTGSTLRCTAAAVAGGLVLAAALAAQNPRAAARGQNPPRPTAGQVVGGGTAQYLVANPGVLNLTPVQVERIRKVSTRVEEMNAPVRTQVEQLTGGRPFRELPPADRRRVGPQLRPLLQQLQTNNEMSLDSIEAILTPEQTNRLENLREDYKQRRDAMRQRMDSARVRPPRRP